MFWASQAIGFLQEQISFFAENMAGVAYSRTAGFERRRIPHIGNFVNAVSSSVIPHNIFGNIRIRQPGHRFPADLRGGIEQDS